MILKSIQVLLAERALDTLIQLRLPLSVKTNYKLAQLFLAVKEKCAALEMTRDQLLVKHNIIKGTLNRQNPEHEPFFREWGEMAELDVEIEKLDKIEKIKLSEIDIIGVVIPIEVIRDLMPFIEA